MGKSIKKVVKKVTKAVKKTVKSFATAPIDGVKSALSGDLGGVGDAMARAASGGTISLGDKGVLNANLTNQPKVADTSAAAPVQSEADGLLQYVSDLRTRKSRRSRSSTNNTGGSSSDSGNKLSGTTALGV